MSPQSPKVSGWGHVPSDLPHVLSPHQVKGACPASPLIPSLQVTSFCRTEGRGCQLRAGVHSPQLTPFQNPPSYSHTSSSQIIPMVAPGTGWLDWLISGADVGAQEGAKVGTGAGLSLSSPNPLLVDPGGLGSSQGSWFSSGLVEAGPGLWMEGGARREKEENSIQGFPSGQGYHRHPRPRRGSPLH